MRTDPRPHAQPAREPARPTLPRVLSIAGTDPSGGAGTAADLKSITAAGGYGMAVVTAVVAQNTHGVRDIHVPPTPVLAAQLAAVADDVCLDAVKTGMLGPVEVIETAEGWIAGHPPRVLMGDPGLVAVADDVCLDAVQAGMLGSVEVIETVEEWIAAHPPRVLMVDPVMVATSGDRLLDPEAEQAMLRFCRAASVVTPNIDELAVLT